MNFAHLHLILNHIAVLGVPFGTALLIYGFLRKSQEVRTTGLLVFVAVALVTVAVFLTGEPAEELVEHLPGVSEHLIESHEGAATIALVATSVLGALSLACLLLPARFGGPLTVFVLIFSLGAAGWLARTATLGGQIRHSEIRQAQAAVMENERERVETLDNEEAREDDNGQEKGVEKDRRGRGRGRHGRDR